MATGKLASGDLVYSLGITDIRGLVGLVQGAYADVVIVSFPRAQGKQFKRSALRRLDEGDSVKYTGMKADVPHHELGEVSCIKDTLLVGVQYMATDLRRGDDVKYAGAATEIPFGEFGKVAGVTEEGVSVQFKIGTFHKIPDSDLRLEFDIPFIALEYVDIKTATKQACLSGRASLRSSRSMLRKRSSTMQSLQRNASCPNPLHTAASSMLANVPGGMSKGKRGR